MIVKVACEPGHRGEATPRRLCFDRRTVELTLALDCWLGADHRYFKMRGADGAIYILRHDIARDLWELTMYGGAPLIAHRSEPASGQAGPCRPLPEGMDPL